VVAGKSRGEGLWFNNLFSPKNTYILNIIKTLINHLSKAKLLKK
jgi:hypothetical protein